MNKYILYSIIGLVIIVIGVVIYMLTGSKKCPGNCNSNGTCQSDGKCKCNNAYIGDDCKQKTTCPSDCNGKGQCKGGKCECGFGFTGNECNIQCDDGHTGKDCKDVRCPNDCSKQGDCLNGKCTCNDGFMGDNCNTPCPSNRTGKDCKDVRCLDDCNGQGDCKDGKCTCYGGYTGPNCIPEVKCPGNGNCNGHGDCIDGKCNCKGNFDGDDCSIVKCEGNGNCNNHGDCKDDGSCTCEKGYGGSGCSLDNRMRFNTLYKIQSNYGNKYVTTCGLYQEDNKGGINVTLNGDKETSDFFKLIKVGDITSTDIVYTTDTFYIKNEKYNAYVTLATKGSGACSPAGGTNIYRYTAIILNVNDTNRLPERSIFNLESSNKELVELNKEYIIRLTSSPTFFMETCGMNTNNGYCQNVETVGFYTDMTYPYKNWKFVLP